MEFVDYKCLESLLIEGEEIAIEGLSEKTKGNLTIGAIGMAILAVIGLNISDYKKDKIYKSQVKANNEIKKKNLEIVNNKYNLSTMSENDYKQFISKIQKESESYIKKMVNKANHDSEYIKSVRNKFIERYKDPDTGELESYDKETLKYLKSGYFKADWDADGYWVIIEDQDVATSGSYLHCDIAEALNAKYSELSTSKIIEFSFGDGDEGCVYFNYVSYETMKKKFSEVGIATEGIISNIQNSMNKRKADKAERIRKREIHDENLDKLFPKAKQALKTIVTKYKSKYPDLPFNLYFYDDPPTTYVSFFKDDSIFIEGSKNYNPKASKVVDEIYNAVKKYCDGHANEYPELKLDVDTPESNDLCITLK